MQARGDTKNNRRHARVGEELTVAVRIIPPPGTPPTAKDSLLFVVTEDVSRSGLRVRSSRLIPVNTRIKLLIALKDPPRTLTYDGVIRWGRQETAGAPYLLGVEFISPPPADDPIWEQYVTSRTRA